MAGQTAYSNLNVFNWGSHLWASFVNSNPGMFSADEVKAARAYLYPDYTYAPVATPPVTKAPADIQVWTTAPASGQDAAATIDRVIAAQNAAWKAQNQDALDATAANLEAAGADAGIPVSWWLIGIAAAAGLLILWRR